MKDSMYKNALANESRDLLELAAKQQIPKAEFRDAIVKRILAAFSARRHVLLVGPAGVGKTAIIYHLAHQMRLSRHRGLRELSTSIMLSGTHYLGDWQSKANSIIEDAKQENSVLYFTDIWNLRTVGRTINDPSGLLDAFRPAMLSGDILLIGEASSSELVAMRQNAQFLQLFELIDIEPLSAEQNKVLVEAEVILQKLDPAPDAIGKIFDLCQQFLPQADGPGPALRLVQQLAHYQQQKAGINEHEALDAAFVEKVFSIYSGLPLFVISRKVVKPIREMRDWFRERVIGQEQAVEAVLEMIALYKAGLHDPAKPIGTFLFMGPTGVGKTELAKALSLFLFGSESRLLRFDMSEFKDFHAFETLLGVNEQSDKPARLLEPVKSQPFQVILFDEIEKAHANVWDLLLQLLDEGRLTAPKGGTVNFRNTIVIATSNVGAQEMAQSTIGFTEKTSDISAAELRKHLEQVFRPELINRFAHIVPFHKLDKSQVKHIAQKELRLVLAREGITSRNLIVDTDDAVLDAVVEHGYDQQYGARALKRELQRRVVLPIANYLLEHKVYSGAILKLDIAREVTRVRVLETEVSRADKKQSVEAQLAESAKKLGLNELRKAMLVLQQRLQALSVGLNEEQLRLRLAQYDQARNAADFWHNREAAYQHILASDKIARVLERLDRLQSNAQALELRLESAPAQQELSAVNNHLQQFETDCDKTERELLLIGEQGICDTLLQIQVVGEDSACRDLLYKTYIDWAESQHYQVTILCEPMVEKDPLVLWLRGAYVYGFLRLEAGLHRLQQGETTAVARVCLAPIRDAEAMVKIGQHVALKKRGCYGGKVRSRLEIMGSPNLIFQNANTLAKNYDLARELGPAWLNAYHTCDDVVRRYQLEPFLVRDHLVYLRSGRQDLLKPTKFNELLEKRLDANAKN